jgi:hypothetical protein
MSPFWRLGNPGAKAHFRMKFIDAEAIVVGSFCKKKDERANFGPSSWQMRRDNETLRFARARVRLDTKCYNPFFCSTLS